MTWAWELELPLTPKFVLMALADEADDNGYCFPSHRRIAKKCSINERSVRRLIARLSVGGYVVVQQRFSHRARTSNGYQILLDHPRTNCPGGPDAAVRGDRTPLSRGPGHGCPGASDMDVPVPTTNPLFDPQLQLQAQRDESGSSAVRAVDRDADGRDLCFPENLGNAQRRALARLLDGLKPEDAQQVLDELAGRMETTRVRDPVRYCRRLVELFRRGEFELEAGRAVARQRQKDRQQDRHREVALRAPALAKDEPIGRRTDDRPVHVREALDRIRRGSNGGESRAGSDGNQQQSSGETTAAG